jgi:hypothetical protein
MVLVSRSNEARVMQRDYAPGHDCEDHDRGQCSSNSYESVLSRLRL